MIGLAKLSYLQDPMSDRNYFLSATLQLQIKRVIDNDLIMYNIQNDFKKPVKLIFPVVFSVEITLSRSHSGNSFEFSHRLTGFPKLRFILSVLLTTLESKTSKLFDNEKVKHGQAPRIYFILFWQRQRPHTAKNNKIIQILNVLFI